jgi:hypothetical protein
MQSTERLFRQNATSNCTGRPAACRPSSCFTAHKQLQIDHPDSAEYRQFRFNILNYHFFHDITCNLKKEANK